MEVSEIINILFIALVVIISINFVYTVYVTYSNERYTLLLIYVVIFLLCLTGFIALYQVFWISNSFEPGQEDYLVKLCTLAAFIPGILAGLKVSSDAKNGNFKTKNKKNKEVEEDSFE